MLIAQISDTHIMARGQKTLGVAPMGANLAACVDFLNRLDPAPDVVLVTGDLTDQGDAAAMAAVAEHLNRLNFPYFAIPGNHDSPANLWRQFAKTACPSRTDAGIDYVVEGYPLRLIGLDSTRPNAPGGALTLPQLDWLAQELGAAPEHPTLIFLHHPPVRLGILETDADGFVGSNALGDVVRGFPNIVRIICGHVHLATTVQWNNTTITTAPGSGMHLALDLTQRKPNQFYLGPPTCLLHHWTAQGRLITHTVSVENRDGPYAFADPASAMDR